MELKDLIGERILTGVDRDSTRIKEYDFCDNLVDCQIINFTLDGITYSAIENPQDGYRSSMREIRASETPTKNTFGPVAVVCEMDTAKEWEDGCDVLKITAKHSGKVVLRVGTENVADYYPGWVGDFNPEALQ